MAEWVKMLATKDWNLFFDFMRYKCPHIYITHTHTSHIYMHTHIPHTYTHTYTH